MARPSTVSTTVTEDGGARSGGATPIRGPGIRFSGTATALRGRTPPRLAVAATPVGPSPAKAASTPTGARKAASGPGGDAAIAVALSAPVVPSASGTPRSLDGATPGSLGASGAAAAPTSAGFVTATLVLSIPYLEMKKRTRLREWSSLRLLHPP